MRDLEKMLQKKQKKIVFLDRDGTLNVDHGYICKPEQMELLPGVQRAVTQLRHAGFATVVVTNQSAIGRGMCKLEDVERCNQRLLELLGADAAPDLILLCPHAPIDGCACRKPGIQLLSTPQFQAQFPDFDLKLSWMVGDKPVDVEFGINAGLPREHCLLLTEKPAVDAATPMAFRNLAAAVQFILQ